MYVSPFRLSPTQPSFGQSFQQSIPFGSDMGDSLEFPQSPRTQKFCHVHLGETNHFGRGTSGNRHFLRGTPVDRTGLSIALDSGAKALLWQGLCSLNKGSCRAWALCLTLVFKSQRQGSYMSVFWGTPKNRVCLLVPFQLTQSKGSPIRGVCP